MRARRAGLPALLVAGGAFLVVAASAAAESRPSNLADISLSPSGGQAVQLEQVVRAHRFTVVVFFSSTCPCFGAHAQRLRDLVRELSPRGVQFLVVDSERHRAGETPPNTVPGTDLPVLRDEGGRLARRLDAQFATESFVFDASGLLRYRGGIDDQRKYLSPNATAHLRAALVRLLDNDAPAFATAKALGCALRLM